MYTLLRAEISRFVRLKKTEIGVLTYFKWIKQSFELKLQ